MRRSALLVVIAGLFLLLVALRRGFAVFGMRQSLPHWAATRRRTFAGGDRLPFAARPLNDSVLANTGAAPSQTISRSRAFSKKRNCRFTSRPTAWYHPWATATSKNCSSSRHDRLRSRAFTHHNFGFRYSLAPRSSSSPSSAALF